MRQARSLWSWWTGLDDVVAWKGLVLISTGLIVTACLGVARDVREVALFSGVALGWAAKATRTQVREMEEARGHLRAIKIESSREAIARQHNPSDERVANLTMTGDDSLVAPLHLTELPLHDYNRIPHIFELGATGSGKSTVLQAMIERMPGDVIIVDPHAKNTAWTGFEVIGKRSKPEEIGRMMRATLDELDRRFRLYEVDREDEYVPLNIIIDEFPKVKGCVDDDLFSEWFGQILREARKVKMRIVILSQGQTVKTLGIQGQAELKENLIFIRGGKFAKDHAKSIKFDELYMWLDKQQFPWTYEDIGLNVPDLSGFKLSPRNPLHPNTQKLLEMIRAATNLTPPTPGTKGESKPIPPSINLQKESEPEPQIDLQGLEDLVLSFALEKGAISVRDVQRKRNIGQRYGLSVSAIEGIFNALVAKGAGIKIPHETTGNVGFKPVTASGDNP